MGQHRKQAARQGVSIRGCGTGISTCTHNQAYHSAQHMQHCDVMWHSLTASQVTVSW